MIEYGVAHPFSADGGGQNPVNTGTLDWIADLPAAAVRLANGWWIADDSTVVFNENWTHSTEDMISLGRAAVDRGLEVTYSVYVCDDLGRQLLQAGQPEDIEAFFASYTQMLAVEAAAAQDMGATTFIIGHEMGEMTSNHRALWVEAISTVREHFSGQVTYAANVNLGPWWDPDATGYQPDNELPTLAFGDLLDLIGLDLYLPPPVEDASKPGFPQVWSVGNVSVHAMMGDWDNVTAYGYSHIGAVRKAIEGWGKPALIIETGFMTYPLGAEPGDHESPPDELAQANLWEAELRMLNFYLGDQVAGLFEHMEFEWDPFRPWEFSVKEKLAEAVLHRWFSGEAQLLDYEIPLSAGTPVVSGLSGNDRFLSSAGAYAIDGGAGTDTVVYSQVRSKYDIAGTPDERTVTAIGGEVRNDRLANVERLQFADVALAYDGAALVAANLVFTAFGPEHSDAAVLIGHWLQSIDHDAGPSAVGAAIVASGPFLALQGASDSDAAFVDLLKTHGAVGDRGALIAQLEAGLPRGELLAQVAAASQAAHVFVPAGIGIELVPAAELPTRPQVLWVTDDVGSDKGIVLHGERTDDVNLRVGGTAAAGDVVSLYANGTHVGTANADASGSWFLTTPALPEGRASFTARASDASGAQSRLSIELPVVIDVSPPQVVSVSPTAASSAVALDTTITVVFNEAVRIGSGFVRLQVVGEGWDIAVFDMNTGQDVRFDGNKVIFESPVPLQPGKTYQLSVPEGAILDATGQGFAAAVVTSFASQSPGQLLQGGAGPDTLDGGSGDDTINGMAGNDRLAGWGGRDTIDGGDGIDTAVFVGARAEYALLNSGASIEHQQGGADNVDTLQGIERLQFSDTKIAMDISGNAGIVAQLIGAIFGADLVRNPVYVGLGLSLLDQGMSAETLAALAISVRVPSGSHVDVVNAVYMNLVGTAPPPNDLALFVSWLDDHTYTPASLALIASGLPLNLSNVGMAELAATGLPFI